MKSICLVLMTALALGTAYAHDAKTVDVNGWCLVATPDFTVISQMDASATAEWAGRLNQFIHAMKGRLPVDARLLGPYTLVLFKSDSDYWASVPVLRSGDPLANVAAFSRAGDWGEMAATCDLGTSQQTQRMVLGTAVSWLLSADHRHRPLALQTGLSEVYGAYVVDNGSEIFGQPVYGWTSRLQRAEANSLNNAETLLNIEDLLAVKDYNPLADVHGVQMFFMESWAFSHFLLFSKEMSKERGMDRLLDAFSHHASPHDAMKEAFGDRADRINSSFRAYVSGGDFYEVVLPVEQAPAIRPPAPADPALVASTLGRLETCANQLDVARSYAEQAIRLAPNDPRPREALALVEFRAHRDAEAAAACHEAMRLGSRDAEVWLAASLEVGRSGPAAPEPGSHVQLTPKQARKAANAAERAIVLFRGIESAYGRVAALVPGVDAVTEDDGKFLTLGQMLFPNDGWIEIGRAQWAHRVNEEALALKLVGDVIARPAAFTTKEVDRAKELQNSWSAGHG